MKTPENAYVLRQSPSGTNRFEEISLPKDVIVNGWSTARGLLAEKDYSRFRDILKAACYKGESGFRKAGYAAATMWRFIYDMKPGDWVVVPHSGGIFYVAEIVGPAYYDDSRRATETDSCYRRKVRWLNVKQPIERRRARSRLISRMKTQQTSAKASDLISEIAHVLELASQKNPKATEGLFAENLRSQMIEAVCREIQDGHMDERKFETLVLHTLIAAGATDANLIPRLRDKGVDIIAQFPIGPVSTASVGVQVKYHRGQTDKHWLDQLSKGLREEGLSLGWFVTSGAFAADTQDYLEGKLAGTGMEISLVDGEQFAGIIVDCGLGNLLKKTTG